MPNEFYNPNSNPGGLHPRVQSFIVISLLGMFAGVLFLPALYPTFIVDADTKQTLFTLVTAGVFYYIGKTADARSGGRSTDEPPKKLPS